jgi:DNA-binding winged helix-turn-helix (wHTH) protein
MDLSFGDFRIDSGGRQLLRNGVYVHLSRKAYELLDLLVATRPRVCTKAELQERLWPGTFVVEANLSNLVAEIRAVLGDDPRRPRFIRTVHGVGYSFIGETTKAGLPGEDLARDSLCWLTLGQQRVQLSDGEHLLGRHPASALTLDSPSVSRHHASIRVQGEEAVLSDLGSRNGTYVQGVRITTPTRLGDGDDIRLGSIVLRFQLASLDAPTTDVPLLRDED